MSASATMAALLAAHPIVLAPMEDVSDLAFRRLCRELGAGVAVTEFVRAEDLIAGSKMSRRRTTLPEDDRPTGIQIHGADADKLRRAAEVAAAARPAFVDLNCGCWVPDIMRRGAGAGWLREPAAMVAMAREIVRAIDLPVTVKTRIGLGPESHMPIVELARRLEDCGVAAIAIHCRTAQMGHTGAADWSWARKARAGVAIPVIVNGDVANAADVVRARAETGCEGVMIGRAAIGHPWIFREARAALAGTPCAPPTARERIAMYRGLVVANVAARGERNGIAVTRRHVGVLGALAATLRPPVFAARSLAETLDVLDAQQPSNT